MMFCPFKGLFPESEPENVAVRELLLLFAEVL